MGTPLFVVEETGQAQRSLRRYLPRSEGNECPSNGYHNASVPIGNFPVVLDEDGDSIAWLDPETFLTHPAWPTHCSCGYEFTEAANRQCNQDPFYAASDGREWILRDAPAGAMWEAAWLGDFWGINGGGRRWIIKLPNGSEFIPGSEASNCTRKGEDHDCWCVHGEAPILTIDKMPEPGRSTCEAGAGSILSGEGTSKEWHGFVRGGELVL